MLAPLILDTAPDALLLFAGKAQLVLIFGMWTLAAWRLAVGNKN